MKLSKDYLEISASVSQHRYFCLMNFCFWKKQNIYIQYTSIFFHLVSSYMALPSLCSNCSVLYNYLLICPEAAIGALEKGYLNFRKHLSISVLTQQLLQKLLEISLQNIRDGVLSKHNCRPSQEFSKTFYSVEKLQRLLL